MTLILLHVLGAMVWTGGHLVLSLAVLPRALAQKDPKIVQDFEAGYERIGIPALVLQVVTGVLLAVRTLGAPANWFVAGSPIAHVVQAKLFLLLLTVGLAVDARLRIIPNLTRASLGSLAAHIVLITLVAVGFVVVGVSFRFGGF